MASPIDQLDLTDPGDEVIRKFRYQFAYGAILLIASASKSLDYSAVWCEHHEDLLGEAPNDLFDAYQVKTRKPEDGEWELNDEGFVKSVRRFSEFESKYPGKLRLFRFVSNAKCSRSEAKDRTHLSPILLVAAVAEAKEHTALVGPAKKGFDLLARKSGAEPERLFAVIRRLELVLGPTDRAFEDEIAQTHLPAIGDCSSLAPAMLAKIRNEIVSKIFEASSLSSSDPAKHWLPLQGGMCPHPLLLAKRVSIDDLRIVVNDSISGATQFLPELATLTHRARMGNMDALQQKLVKGGLAGHYEVMRRRALTAEQALLALATQPDGRSVVSQIENVVLGQCKDSEVEAEATDSFGAAMLLDVQRRLFSITKDKPEFVHHRDYELLMGVAALLTDQCLVWWSQAFQLEATS